MDSREGSILIARDEQNEGELSFIDLIAFVRNNLLLISSCASVGISLALLVAFMMTPLWEGTVLVRVGQYAEVNALNSNSEVAIIEPVLQVIERVNNKSFKDDVLKRLGIVTSKDTSKIKLFRDQLKAKSGKSEFMVLTLRAEYPEEVISQLDAVIVELKSIHDKKLEPIIKRAQHDISTIDEDISRTKAEISELKNSLSHSTVVNERNFSQIALISQMLGTRETDLMKLNEAKFNIESQIATHRTFSTSAVSRVEVSDRPVFPNKVLFAVVGLIVGVVMGVMVAIVKPRN